MANQRRSMCPIREIPVSLRTFSAGPVTVLDPVLTDQWFGHSRGPMLYPWFLRFPTTVTSHKRTNNRFCSYSVSGRSGNLAVQSKRLIIDIINNIRNCSSICGSLVQVSELKKENIVSLNTKRWAHVIPRLFHFDLMITFMANTQLQVEAVNFFKCTHLLPISCLYLFPVPLPVTKEL